MGVGGRQKPLLAEALADAPRSASKPDAGIRFVSAQPDEPFFIWQSHVYLHNFLALGLDPRRCIALFGVPPGRDPSPRLRALERSFPEADIQLYRDTRDEAGRAYSPSIQPHLIVKAFQAQPHLKEGLVYYHDCDVAFRRLPDVDRMLREHPGCSLLSDTIDYIGYEYLHGCCEKIREQDPSVPTDDLFHRMCDVVGIDPDVVVKNEAVSGGAQYLLRDVDSGYWEKVYTDSVNLWKLFESYPRRVRLQSELKDCIQVWTAGMWAYLWNLWLRGHETAIHEEMGFLFSGESSHHEAPVLHMAGLPDDLKPTHFDKQAWVNWNPVELLRVQPYLFDQIPRDTVSREYADIMHEIAGIAPWRGSPPVPARWWRILVWRTESDDAWDVSRAEFRFDGVAGAQVPIDSGCAGPGFEARNAFDGDPKSFWGGRADAVGHRCPSYFLGVRLEEEALPDRLTLTQRGNEHSARVALVQYSRNGRDWTTAHVAKLNPEGGEQILFYRSDRVCRAREWRISTTRTVSGWGWDVPRLAFLCDNGEQAGFARSSGHAYPEDVEQYGAQHAFEDSNRFWGGRPDANGLFHLGFASEEPRPVNRVVLEQRAPEVSATRVAIQCRDGEDGWRTVRSVSGLRAGINDILLFEAEAPKAWTRPELTTGAARG